MTAASDLPCARCAKPLEPCSTRHGVLWLCRECASGATTLGVIRKVAPRPFVKHLWRAAQLHGRDSSRPCPSCTQPLQQLDPKAVDLSPPLELCPRCLLVWLDPASRAALRLDERSRPAARRVGDSLEDSVSSALAAARQLAAVVDTALDDPGA